jgi:hypothetical protein
VERRRDLESRRRALARDAASRKEGAVKKHLDRFLVALIKSAVRLLPVLTGWVIGKLS